MSNVLDLIKKRREQLEKARTIRDRKKGALDQILARLKKEHGIERPEDIEKELKKLETREAKLTARLHQAVKDFEAKYGKKIDRMLSDT